MGFSLIGIDKILGGNAQIIIRTQPNAVDGFPLEELLPIQFPPRITDDVKNANWAESDNLASYEPTAIWKGASARKVGIELVYIVTGAAGGQNSVKFTASQIAKITKQVRGYFYRSIEDADPPPVVELEIYDHIGAASGASPAATFRLLDSSVTHGDTIIKDSTGTFPLLTKIHINAALFTQISGKQAISSGLAPKPRKEWY